MEKNNIITRCITRLVITAVPLRGSPLAFVVKADRGWTEAGAVVGRRPLAGAAVRPCWPTKVAFSCMYVCAHR